MNIQLRRMALVALIPVLAATACESDDPLPTPAPTPTPTAPPPAPAAAPRDIVDTAVAAGSFTKLVAAVMAADLVATLKGPGPFTVFAPTDEAFAKLPPGTLDELLRPENRDRLRSILTYHVVPGKVMKADVATLNSAATVQGQRVTIAVSPAGVKIDNANVVTTDIDCTNGVIHVIDTVLIPQ